MFLLRKKICALIVLGTLISLSQIVYYMSVSQCLDHEGSVTTRPFGGSPKHGVEFKLDSTEDRDHKENARQSVKQEDDDGDDGDGDCSWTPGDLTNRANSLELGDDLIPNNVYYVWCDNTTFQFQHYLSVKSAWDFLRADIIEIHFQHEPLQNSYDSWLDELRSTIPSLSLKKMPSYIREDHSCSPLFGIDVLYDRGGVYVSHDTILTDTVTEYRKKDFASLYDNDGTLKVLFSRSKEKKLNALRAKLKSEKPYVLKYNTSTVLHSKDSGVLVSRNCSILHSKTSGVVHSEDFDVVSRNLPRCVTIENMDWTGIKHLKCFVLNLVIRPVEIMVVRTDIADMLRFLYYGVTSPVHRPYVEKTSHIPKLIHYVWYHEANMSYRMYLSVLSSLYIVRPERIYVHGDQMLRGRYWDTIKSHPKITRVYRETPQHIYGKTIRFTHHKSDVIRAQILLKYGGIYLDWDVIWLKPIDDLLSTEYDVILNYDHVPTRHFPNTINMGVVMAKPDAEFLRIWQSSYRDYRNEDFVYNPIQVPYKLYEKHPWLVRIERHLQVMCYLLKCHPVFHPDYKTLHESQPFDWRTDAYAIHFTHPDPPEMMSETLLRNASGMFADIGRQVLKKAGEL